MTDFLGNCHAVVSCQYSLQLSHWWLPQHSASGPWFSPGPWNQLISRFSFQPTLWLPNTRWARRPRKVHAAISLGPARCRWGRGPQLTTSMVAGQNPYPLFNIVMGNNPFLHNLLLFHNCLFKVVIFQWATSNNRGELWKAFKKKEDPNLIHRTVILDAFHSWMMYYQKATPWSGPFPSHIGQPNAPAHTPRPQPLATQPR